MTQFDPAFSTSAKMFAIDRRRQSVVLCLLTPFLTGYCLLGCDHSEPLPKMETRSPASSREIELNPRNIPESPEFVTGTLPRFSIVGSESGLNFQRFDDISGQRRIVETNGGGVAFIDYDRDGWLDVFFTNGCPLPFKPDDRRFPSALFRNLGVLKFSAASGRASLTQFGFATGCAVGDYNADGFDDLYVTAFRRNAMWYNNGDGTFQEKTSETGTGVPVWSSSAAFADLDDDGVLDLYVVNYLVESDTQPRLCPNPASPSGYSGCSPALFEGVNDVLFLGEGEGGFVDSTAAAGLAELPGKGLGVVISDLDLDGSLEIYVANDGEANYLLTPQDVPSADSIRRTLVYEDMAFASGLALNERGHAQASMGIAAGDIDANGTTDLFLTHFYGDTNTLYLNAGNLSFQDATRGSGLGASSRRWLGFGTCFLDFDNDGWIDLFVANGHVDDRTWMPGGQPYRMPPQMYRNERNSTFLEVSAQSGDYFYQSWIGRGVTCGDLDRDGRIDLAVSHQLAPSFALRNETESSGRSIRLHLVGVISNRNGYTARVEVVGSDPLVARELSGGGSFQSAHAPELHLGLGNRDSAEIHITWPSGIVDTHKNVETGDWIAIEGGRLWRIPSGR